MKLLISLSHFQKTLCLTFRYLFISFEKSIQYESITLYIKIKYMYKFASTYVFACL